MKSAGSLAVATVAWLCLLVSAQAENPDHLTRLLETGACVACDLAGADLSGAVLRGVDLTEADMTGANLTGADLSDASLINANLLGADLTDAILAGTDLSGAILDDVTVSLRALWEAVICYTWLPNGQMYLLQQNCP